jgi:tRNA threonylcarbamoyl adenosine modification protein YjeE
VSWTVTARASSPEATRRLGAALAGVARTGDLVVLAGALGAGKTTFAQGFARGLGVEGPVTSPTFTLLRQYPCALGHLLHADVYRLEQLADVVDLGLGELVEDGVALVEWGDVAGPALGPVTWTVILEPTGATDGSVETGVGWPDGCEDGETVRTVTITGDDDDRGPAVIAAVTAA